MNKAINRCLYYLLTFPNGTIVCTASVMLLCVKINGSYLVEDSAKIRVGGHYFLSEFIKCIDKAQPKLNGPIYTLCNMLKNIVASASECKWNQTLKMDKIQRQYDEH